jgi:hypothetical protein
VSPTVLPPPLVSMMMDVSALPTVTVNPTTVPQAPAYHPVQSTLLLGLIKMIAVSAPSTRNALPTTVLTTCADLSVLSMRLLATIVTSATALPRLSVLQGCAETTLVCPPAPSPLPLGLMLMTASAPSHLNVRPRSVLTTCVLTPSLGGDI